MRTLFWVVTILVAVGMALAGLSKFLQPAHWHQLFTGWGYPGWLSPVVGGTEIAGAIGLLVPRLALGASILLAGVMIGAVGTLLTHPHGAMGSGLTPGIYLLLLTSIAAVKVRAATRSPKH